MIILIEEIGNRIRKGIEDVAMMGVMDDSKISYYFIISLSLHRVR